jgi:ABC-2 type transport system permease protein
MRLAWAFLVRDAKIAMSYRISFLVSLLGNLLILAVFYFVVQTAGIENVSALREYGGSLLAFLLIGIALTDCVGVSLTGFATQIREGQMTGTLEITMLSPAGLPAILICSSLWGYVFSGIRLLLYLVIGGFLYGVDLGNANLPAGLLIFLLTVLAFMGVGILWASVVLLIKRGESIMTMLSYLVVLTSGVLFPATVLPGWLQSLSLLSPLTYALDGMRRALLRGTGIGELVPTVGILLLFSAVFMTSGLAAFLYSIRLARRSGTLAEY